MNKKFLFFLMIIVVVRPVKAQTKQTTTVNQVWLGYYNQTRFSNKWGTWTDLHLRTKEDFFSHLSVSIIRVGLTYYLSDATKLTAGYAYVSFYPGDNHKNVTQPEHRPWQQIQWHTEYAKTRTMQWLRLEERFRRKILNDSTLASDYNFNWKIRYNLLFQVPLSKKGAEPGTWSFIANDEVHINFGKQIVNNYFDQNRFFLGFAYHTNKTNNLQIGYMNVFQQLAAGNQYKSIHAARIFYFHNLDLRKNKK
ncbi:MAG: DUF2490 domain-containing protein [Bacteroidota bacterium]